MWQDQDLKPYENLKEKVFWINKQTGDLFDKEIVETAALKSFLIFLFTFVYTPSLFLSELMYYILNFEKAALYGEDGALLNEIGHIFWNCLGVQIACLDALFFDEIHGAMIISILHRKLNHDIPKEAAVKHPYKHVTKTYGTLLKRYSVYYPAPCMQVCGNMSDTLEMGDHTHSVKRCDQEYYQEKLSQKRFIKLS